MASEDGDGEEVDILFGATENKSEGMPQSAETRGADGPSQKNNRTDPGPHMAVRESKGRRRRKYLVNSRPSLHVEQMVERVGEGERGGVGSP